MSQDLDYVAMVRALGNGDARNRAADDPTVTPFITPVVAKTRPPAPKEPDFDAMAQEIHHGNPAAEFAPDVKKFRDMSRAMTAPSFKR